MYISKVSLVNYRNFENSFFLFNKGINTIIVFTTNYFSIFYKQ